MTNFEKYINDKGYSWSDFDRAYEMENLIEQYAEYKLKEVKSEQLVCECGNKLTDKEVYFGQCLQCDKNVEE